MKKKKNRPTIKEGTSKQEVWALKSSQKRYYEDLSLGNWCDMTNDETPLNQIQQGKSTKINLSQDRIEQLETLVLNR